MGVLTPLWHGLTDRSSRAGDEPGDDAGDDRPTRPDGEGIYQLTGNHAAAIDEHDAVLNHVVTDIDALENAVEELRDRNRLLRNNVHEYQRQNGALRKRVTHLEDRLEAHEKTHERPHYDPETEHNGEDQ